MKPLNARPVPPDAAYSSGSTKGWGHARKAPGLIIRTLGNLLVCGVLVEDQGRCRAVVYIPDSRYVPADAPYTVRRGHWLANLPDFGCSGSEGLARLAAGGCTAAFGGALVTNPAPAADTEPQTLGGFFGTCGRQMRRALSGTLSHRKLLPHRITMARDRG